MPGKFKVGGRITAIDKGRGFDEAVVLDTFISEEKRTKGKEMYLLKIMCGTATIPIGADVNYQLYKGKK